MGLHNTNKNEFHGFGNLILWLWKSVEKVLKIFLKKFVQTGVISRGGSGGGAPLVKLFDHFGGAQPP